MTTLTFGGTVQVVPPTGDAFEVFGIFRETPIEVADGDGVDVLIVSPTLALPRPEYELVPAAAQIRPGNGSSYRILNRITEGSPAADGMILIELEMI